MTTEEIIQRLLDEKRITVKEALTILRDIVRNEIIYHTDSSDDNNYKSPFITVMYGVGPAVSSYYDTSIYDNNTTSCSNNSKL